jgi:galactokinase
MDPGALGAGGLGTVCPGARNLPDPWPAWLGRAWQALAIDPRFGTVDYLSLAGYALVVTDSGAPHIVTGHELEAHEAGHEAARVLRAKSLRSVEPGYLKANRSRLTPRQHECAYHTVAEIQRVVAAERALRQGDLEQFGHYLSLSHDSAREHWKGCSAEADQLAALARETPGCLGARGLSASRRGAALSLVAYHQVVLFCAGLAARYRARTGREPVSGSYRWWTALAENGQKVERIGCERVCERVSPPNEQ